MGLAFAVLLQLVIIFILCTPVAIIGGIIFYFFSKKEKRKEKTLLAIFSPFIALYTFYLSSLFGYGIIAEYKNTDIGVGDCWSVPLTNDYNLVFIDTPDLASISGKEHIISDIKQIQQDRNTIYGKIQNGCYFTFNTTTNELKYFSDKKELKRTITSEKKLVEAIDFYYGRREEIAGPYFTAATIISLIISIFSIYITKHIIRKKPDHSIYKPTISHYRRLYRKPPSQ